MTGFIIDPEKKSFKEIKLPDQEQARLKKIIELLGTSEYHITFIYPQEYTTCTGYLTIHRPGAPFFRVKGFVGVVKFGMTIVIDKTATGFPKSDGITLADLKPMITFVAGKRTVPK